MSTRQTICARAKKTEREVQQFLWPGTRFAAGAKRPALEDCDLRGEDRDGWPLWGEVKNYGAQTIQGEGGAYAVLAKAYAQSQAAIERNPQDWPNGSEELWDFLHECWVPAPDRPRPFSVLWPKGSRRDDQRLVMYELAGYAEPLVMTLAQFKQWVIDAPKEQVA